MFSDACYFRRTRYTDRQSGDNNDDTGATTGNGCHASRTHELRPILDDSSVNRDRFNDIIPPLAPWPPFRFPAPPRPFPFCEGSSLIERSLIRCFFFPLFLLFSLLFFPSLFFFFFFFFDPLTLDDFCAWVVVDGRCSWILRKF